MSYFKSLNRYCERYKVKNIDRLLLYSHYPLFKIFWQSEYGKKVVKKIARQLYPLFRNYRISHRLKLTNGVEIKVPLSFESGAMASYLEVFWGNSYSTPFEMESIKTVVDLGANTGMASLYFLIEFSLSLIHI